MSKEKKRGIDEKDEGKFERELGARPSESLVLVRGIFRNEAFNCKKGFGMCTVSIIDSPENTKETRLDSAHSALDEDIISARLQRSTDTSDVLSLIFQEKVPYWENTFYVGKTPKVFTEVLGYDTIRVVPGAYPAYASMGDFGGVDLKIIKGKRIPTNR